MAYRRRQSVEDDFLDESLSYSKSYSFPNSNTGTNSLAAKAMRASSSAATRRESSLSSAYGPRPVPPPSAAAAAAQPHLKDRKSPEYTSFNSFNESNSKQGFWGSLARKAKAFIDDDYDAPQVQTQTQTTAPAEYHNPYNLNESTRKTTEGPMLQKGLGRISSSISYIGNAVEEGLTKVENRTAGIIQETRKHIKKKPSAYQQHNKDTKQSQVASQVQPPTQTDLELQLKASRDVSMAMAAKAKLLLRELKTVKADFAFAKERCAQLEEENKMLRENRERGGRPEDDDLIRLQLESLLAEKARLAHENSVFARENRFLREVVEYHQLTMQDVVYMDEGTEEVSEVYPIKVVSDSQPASTYSMPNPSLHPFRGLNHHEFPSESD